MAKIHNLFSTPILQMEVPEEMVTKVQEIVLPKLDKLEHQGKNHNNDMSSDFFTDRIIKPDDYEEFFDFLVQQSNTYCNTVGYRTCNKMNWWVQDYRQEGKHRRHNHGGSIVSGVFWIRANEHAGSLMFENPVRELGVMAPHFDNPFTDALKEVHFVRPYTGLLVLFPSYIYHEVEESKAGVERTVLAFNMDP